MRPLFESMSARLQDLWKRGQAPAASRASRCVCGRPVFFDNSLCLNCGRPLGYEPRLGRVLALQPGPQPGTWQPAAELPEGEPRPLYRRCGNFDSAAGCNWLVEDAQALCRSCRLNRVIPDLSLPENQVLWGRIEAAKRRLVSQLIGLGLPVRTRLGEDPARGLAFDLLRALPGGPPVMTGHADGIITLNAEEADPAYRERTREHLQEPYRTVLGHLRHEVGHYYWDRLVAHTPWLEPFRRTFGDERQDYAAALRRHYEQGAPADWQSRHVSAYASAHPWEDWAETWAHYLHMVDTLDTALSFGLDADSVEPSHAPYTPETLQQPADATTAGFLSFVNAWMELTCVLNELSRSMGQPDFYPFVLSAPAVDKLHFVHRVVTQYRDHPGPD
ncbi:putative zinc-binding metallopeptidase [Caldimonas thermodepolymerans]|jgi:hypothetical protein|uniref:Zinc-ribbon domain-containing protein n=1 Tax=Caldimonas thermodepolymerans TaxID=215580 RepID=A0A2S5T8Z9_9BURK|nr:putative zinc-binding metallopeptidase [Caldimonas thermodepolymerans]PPE71402.1 hypothetical protein C1702_03010 [Caldimonas thermodepolymerans]QPC32578.1 putative zinc-binding metallopeptidase [Caldimonas thermodepolymerans]RDH98977.1 hypothetical protein DES46_106249 [Caldimonas thermodepolymerans]UZG45381.1 putative zinc-binding peptidase [Caldimonas thermodepolymerans]